MVDVADKHLTGRRAVARAHVRMSRQAAVAVERGDGPKGEVLGVARLAGIMAAKQTAQLIPLAHPLELTFVDVVAHVDVEAGLVEIVGEARTRARTGVEMEAMTACSVAALAVYDMVKGIERGVEIEQVVLLEKSGGRHDYRREPADGQREAEPPHELRTPAARAAVITISTSKASGTGSDESGPRLAQLAARIGADVVASELIADDRDLIEARLRHWSGPGACALILTTGGTGLSPSDVTPEATAAVIERAVPGLAEAMRAASRPYTEHWALSRGVAGVCGGTLIVNLPGSPRSVAQLEPTLAAALPHALALIAGERPH